MNLTLRKEDRQAVDLLLDRVSQMPASSAGQSTYATPNPELGSRVAQAQNLLHMLDLMPGLEPPDDLVSRTLRFVQQSSAAHDGVGHDMLHTSIDTHHPHA
jgi:hypothetical protein